MFPDNCWWWMRSSPLPGAVLSHCCGQPHYGPDLIITERSKYQMKRKWTDCSRHQTTQIMGQSYSGGYVGLLYTFSEISRKLLETFYRESEKRGKFDQGSVYLLLIFPCHFRLAPIIHQFPGFWLVRHQNYLTLIGQKSPAWPGPIFLLHLSRWQFLVTLAPVQILVWSSLSHATKLFLLGIIEVSEEWDCKRVTRKTRPRVIRPLTHSDSCFLWPGGEPIQRSWWKCWLNWQREIHLSHKLH